MGEGAHGTEYTIWKGCACKWSPVLRAAFESKKSPSSTYHFTNIIKSTLYLLKVWLEKQELATSSKAEDSVGVANSLIELWILAEKLKIPSLQNMTIRKIHEFATATKKINTPKLAYIYENTTDPKSPLRRIFVHLVAFNLRSEAFAELPELFPQEMLIELVTFYSKTCRKIDPDAKKSSIENEDYMVSEKLEN